MKTLFSISAIVVSLCLHQTASGELQTILYDDFQNGNFSSWTVGSPNSFSGTTVAPAVVPSDQDYAIAGVGPANPSGSLYIPLAFTSMELSISFRAKSAAGWPNHADIILYNTQILETNGFANYRLMDYGENDRLDLWRNNGYNETTLYALGGQSHAWHVYTASRDAQGWWSLSIDGQVQYPNVVQDGRWTSFEGICVDVASFGSQIDWVSVQAVPVPGALLLGALGLSMAGWRLRRTMT